MYMIYRLRLYQELFLYAEPFTNTLSEFAFTVKVYGAEVSLGGSH